MFIKEDDLKLNEWQFSQRKFLPYEIKTKLAETRIREWYDNCRTGTKPSVSQRRESLRL